MNRSNVEHPNQLSSKTSRPLKETHMKPISQLAIYRSARNIEETLQGFLSLTQNPKRHLRGPRFSAKPGNGKLIEAQNASYKSAVCGCANGLIDLIARGGRRGNVASATRQILNDKAFQMHFDVDSFATVSDKKGLKAIRRVVKLALQDL